MQRRNQFITAAITAALTFGVLTLTLGQRQYNAWRGHHHGGWGHHHHDCDDDHDNANSDQMTK